MKNLIDITNERFNRWTVLSRDGSDTQKQAMWLCECDCGQTKRVTGYCLRSGRSKSCGCLKRDATIARATTHGMTGTRFYRAWKNMRNRCLNKNGKDFHRYGGRGIQVCSRWNKFENFKEDMFWSYKDSLEIDRVDNDGDYSKENCRWTTRLQQNNNTSANVNITHKGQSMSVSRWAKSLDMSVQTLWSRLYRYGWTVEDALTKPARKLNKTT